MDDVLVERVLRLVEQVPAGRVVSYGDLARALGTGPRQIGKVMAHWGHDVPWWRVTSAAGQLPEHLLADARRHWEAEGIALSRTMKGCRIAEHRWAGDGLAAAAKQVERDLATASGATV
ncbi:MGMT family protein [Luteococcus sp. Sow4_B9]|uniref:MGMT family protein n=1 Tax=Luteococcus sp. Sow4_B9 TaxID=3438792 RepID=UPI003F96CB8A